MLRNVLLALAFAALAACSSLTTITSPQSGTQFELRDKAFALPGQQSLKGTSFGNYEFRATNGSAPAFFGVLPLQFKGGHLAADIIFFAPATMFNLRGAFPYYDIDVGKGVIRYKLKAGDPWTEYTPKTEEAFRAKGYFEQRDHAGK